MNQEQEQERKRKQKAEAQRRRRKRRSKAKRDLTREQQLARGPVDLPFLMLTLLLLGIGLIMLLSASSYAARYDRNAGYDALAGTFGDPFYFFRHQAIFAVAGIAAMFGISRWNYQNLRWMSLPVLGAAVVLLILVLTPLGVTANHATRWLKLLFVAGPTYQPSEIAKLGVVLTFSAMLSKRRTGPRKFKRQLKQPWQFLRGAAYGSGFMELIPYGAILLVLSVLMIKEPHLSGTILILAGGAAILFASGIHLAWFGAGISAVAAVGYYIIFIKGYNSSRLDIWLDPWSDPQNTGYQMVQSLYAVSSGGLTGMGFGLSRQKYLYLPEEQNDFIFAVISEELGFVGATLIVVLFALLVIRGYWLALHARDRFGSLLVVGITTMLAVQVFLNMAVVTNVIPCTGISLPFFSYGGTALLIQLAEMGIVLAVSRQIPAAKQG